jgi:hypothetical protein
VIGQARIVPARFGMPEEVHQFHGAGVMAGSSAVSSRRGPGDRRTSTITHSSN